MKARQRLRHAQNRGGDDWLITYADTITLLLCLFVVMLSVKSAGRPHVEAPQSSFFVLPPRQEISPADVVVVPPPSPPVEVVPVSPPSAVDRLRNEGTPVVEQKGDRLTTLEISSGAFFASGFATLSFSGKAILRDVAATLKSPLYADYRVTIEGHTDDMPINTAQFQSNWELSTARAASVVRFFLEQGIAAAKLRAAGYADTFPVAPNRGADGAALPENQAKNRRVVIRLERVDKAGG